MVVTCKTFWFLSHNLVIEKILKSVIWNLMNWMRFLPFYSHYWQLSFNYVNFTIDSCHSIMFISLILSHSSFMPILGLVSLIQAFNCDHHFIGLYLISLTSYHWLIITHNGLIKIYVATSNWTDKIYPPQCQSIVIRQMDSRIRK